MVTKITLKRTKPNTKYGHYKRDVLTEDVVKSIKERLWYGESTVAIGREMECPANTIVNIYTGHRWAGVPWPNRATSGMPKERKDMIEQARKIIHDKEVPKMVRHFLKTRERAR